MFSIIRITRLIIGGKLLVKRNYCKKLMRIKKCVKELEDCFDDEQTIKYLRKYKYKDISNDEINDYKKTIPIINDTNKIITKYIKELEGCDDEQTIKYLRKYKYKDITYTQLKKYKECLKI